MSHMRHVVFLEYSVPLFHQFGLQGLQGLMRNGAHSFLQDGPDGVVQWV